jgi:nitrate reductase gamma subunit
VNRTTALALLVIGIIFLLAGAAVHFAVKVTIVPHVSIILGVVAVVLIVAGLYGMVARRAA